VHVQPIVWSHSFLTCTFITGEVCTPTSAHKLVHLKD